MAIRRRQRYRSHDRIGPARWYLRRCRRAGRPTPTMHSAARDVRAVCLSLRMRMMVQRRRGRGGVGLWSGAPTRKGMKCRSTTSGRSNAPGRMGTSPAMCGTGWSQCPARYQCHRLECAARRCIAQICVYQRLSVRPSAAREQRRRRQRRRDCPRCAAPWLTPLLPHASQGAAVRLAQGRAARHSTRGALARLGARALVQPGRQQRFVYTARAEATNEPTRRRPH